MDLSKLALEKHTEWHGKIETGLRADVSTTEGLSIAYTPGVAAPCLEIKSDINKSFDYTRRWNTVAVITDGTAVLGLGDIGPEAGMPVMEGKCVLFKAFGDVDAVPLCIKSKDVDTIVETICLLEGSFGGINLEDIAAPRCFEIEEKLKKRLSIPVFHDDQHGTAVVASAALINAMKVVGKRPADVKVVMNGAGAAGIAIATMLLDMGYGDVILCDRNGTLVAGDPRLTPAKEAIAQRTNRDRLAGSLAEALKGADVFIGVSGPNLVTKEMVSTMKEPIVFAMANPVPEIDPEEAKAAGAVVVGSGRSDYPNQINNVLVFPGMFRGAFDARARDINEAMKIAAAKAIAGIIPDDEITPENIIPQAFDPRVKDAVATAVAKAARESHAC